jgi:hypothetical protein
MVGNLHSLRVQVAEPPIQAVSGEGHLPSTSTIRPNPS